MLLVFALAVALPLPQGHPERHPEPIDHVSNQHSEDQEGGL
jgi:hypothetical protein